MTSTGAGAGSGSGTRAGTTGISAGGRPPGCALPAPAPGWTLHAEVVVVGSGVAGLTAALRCAAAGLRTVVVTKARLDDGSTRWAQGGIAAALGEGDSPEQHLDDTLVAGAALCDEEAVRALVTEGPDAVRRLIATGARFDTAEDGDDIALTREGGHHRSRIAHAGGDATGAEISRALVAAVRLWPPRPTGPRRPARPLAVLSESPEYAQYEGDPPPGEAPHRTPRARRRTSAATAVRDQGIRTIENALVLDLLRSADGRTRGVTLHVMGEGQHDGVGAVHAPAVVLATGGMGQIFSATTNPAVSTGDGVALALRAGAEVSDLEFVQFHPTVLYLGPGAEGQQPLISEAVRGEGAHLVDADGVRFMLGQHELAELAPRDIVAKAIMRRAREQGVAHLYLDARHFGARMWQNRFPTILAACRSHGIDPVTELVPVAPAAHYASGGVRTDLRGRTTVPGLYACGEVACTGVHGANRLASNSLLEGLVFAERIASDIAARGADDLRGDGGAEAAEPADAAGPAGAGRPDPSDCVMPLLPPEVRSALQRIMTDGAGVLRSARSLGTAAAQLAALPADSAHKPAEPGVETWETANLHLVARVLVAAAQRRTETRGCHWREDHAERDDTAWRRHLVVALRPDEQNHRLGTLVMHTTETTSFPPADPADPADPVPPAHPARPAHPAACKEKP